MLCRVEQPTNEQTYGRYFRWRALNMRGYGGKFILVWLPVFLLAYLAYNFWVGFNLIMPLVLLAASGGYSLYTLYAKPGMIFRKQSGVALQTEVYLFTENGFTRSVRNEEGGHPENSSHQYSALVRAVETKSDFYIFHSQNQAYLVDKEYFDKGDPAQLRETLKAKLGDKFATKEK